MVCSTKTKHLFLLKNGYLDYKTRVPHSATISVLYYNLNCSTGIKMNELPFKFVLLHKVNAPVPVPPISLHFLI